MFFFGESMGYGHEVMHVDQVDSSQGGRKWSGESHPMRVPCRLAHIVSASVEILPRSNYVYRKLFECQIHWSSCWDLKWSVGVFAQLWGK